MSRITTHVLDTVLGKPGAGIRVRLERREHDGWLEVAASATDSDGRCKDLMADATAGAYRITFETADYFARAGRKSIYPEISIAFLCGEEEHYHLPLLLSDNSYTTYRGS